MTLPPLRHKAADGTLVEAGQEWAYRVRQAGDLVQVDVVRLGAQRPARVLVAFADEVFEGPAAVGAARPAENPLGTRG